MRLLLQILSVCSLLALQAAEEEEEVSSGHPRRYKPFTVYDEEDSGSDSKSILEDEWEDHHFQTPTDEEPKPSKESDLHPNETSPFYE